MKKYFFLLAIVLTFFLSSLPKEAWGEIPLSVYIRNQLVEPSSIIRKGDDVLVAADILADRLNISITVDYPQSIVIIGREKAKVDNIVMRGSVYYLPLVTISKLAGADYRYYITTNTIDVSYPPKHKEPELPPKKDTPEKPKEKQDNPEITAYKEKLGPYLEQLEKLIDNTQTINNNFSASGNFNYTLSELTKVQKELFEVQKELLGIKAPEGYLEFHLSLNSVATRLGTAMQIIARTATTQDGTRIPVMTPSGILLYIISPNRGALAEADDEINNSRQLLQKAKEDYENIGK